MEVDMDPTRLSRRTLETLEKMPADKRRRAEEAIARTQTSEARARDAAERLILHDEYRWTGQISVLSDLTGPEERRRLRNLIDELRARRIAAGLSLDDLSRRLDLDPSVLGRLEDGTQINPSLGALCSYARGLGLELDFSLHPATNSAAQSSILGEDESKTP